MSLTGCHIWRQIMPTGGVNASHSGKVLSRPGLCNYCFLFPPNLFLLSCLSFCLLIIDIDSWAPVYQWFISHYWTQLFWCSNCPYLASGSPFRLARVSIWCFPHHFFFFENPFYFGHNEVFQDHFVYTLSQPWNQPFLWGAQIPFRGESVQHLKIHVFSDPLGCLSVGPMLSQLPVAWLMNFGSSWNDGV